MSLNLSLVEYNLDDDGNPYEDQSKIIESAFINPEIIDLFEAQSLLKERPLYEEAGSAESSKIKCLDDLSLDAALSILESEFIKTISSEAANNAKSILIREEISSLISDCRAITNLYHLIKLKKEKFAHHSNTVLKLG